MLWTCSGLHPIFIYICIKVQMFFTFQKPCVIFLLNFLPLFLQLSLLWRYHMWYFLLLLPQLCLLWNCHLWYLCSLSCCLQYYWHCPYHCWHYKWFHFTPHRFLCPVVEILYILPLINDKYNGKIFDRKWQTQILWIPLICI